MSYTITNSSGKTMYWIEEAHGYMTAKARREYFARKAAR